MIFLEFRNGRSSTGTGGCLSLPFFFFFFPSVRQHSLIPGQEVSGVLLPDARLDLLYCFVFPE